MKRETAVSCTCRQGCCRRVSACGGSPARGGQRTQLCPRTSPLGTHSPGTGRLQEPHAPGLGGEAGSWVGFGF